MRLNAFHHLQWQEQQNRNIMGFMNYNGLRPVVFNVFKTLNIKFERYETYFKMHETGKTNENNLKIHNSKKYSSLYVQ